MKNSLKGKVDPVLFSIYQNSVADLMQNAEEVQRLTMKAANLRDSMPDLTARCEQLSAAKKRVLADCAIDSASDSDLAIARENCDGAVRRLAEAEELLQAVIAALRTAQSKSPSLQNKKDEACKKIWRSLHTLVMEQIREESGYLFQCLEVCAQKMGYNSQGNPFVGTPRPSLIELMRRMEQGIFSPSVELRVNR